jgi:predicted O-methyltransferase YrrM
VKLEEVDGALAELGVPRLTSTTGGRMLFDFVLGSGAEDVLELGFAHGMSTAYLAAALHERGAGRVTTFDRRDALHREPNIHAVLGRLGLEAFVRPIVAERSYTWELMRLLRERTAGGEAGGAFDFCFIDGAHTWDVDGFAFFLVDKLLRPDRWLLFDDLHWTQASSPAEDLDDDVPDEERQAAQIELVFDLLVRAHPEYVHFRVLGNYGWAYKRAAGGGAGVNADAVDRVLAPALVRELVLGGRRPSAEASRPAAPTQ